MLSSASLWLFQSTLPVWGATPRACLQGIRFYDFNPRSPCGERQHRKRQKHQNQHISIHAPRVGSDEALQISSGIESDFNPRSPCGERPQGMAFLAAVPGFQSTLPVWGATCFQADQERRLGTISIHAPRVGSDVSQIPIVVSSTRFQSTLPVWGATTPSPVLLVNSDISIHAPRVGSDNSSIRTRQSGRNFNPRSPCGERPLP